MNGLIGNGGVQAAHQNSLLLLLGAVQLHVERDGSQCPGLDGVHDGSSQAALLQLVQGGDGGATW